MTQRSCHFQRIIKLSYKPRRHMRRPVSGQSGQKNRSTISSAPANGIRQRPIFPTRLQVSIVGSAQLNFCVRNGNRWFLRDIATGNRILFSFRTFTYCITRKLEIKPSTD